MERCLAAVLAAGVVAHAARRRPEAVTLAHRHFRDHPAGVPQDRHPRRAVEDPDQAHSAVSLPARADDRAHARPNTRSKPMTVAAIAADEPRTPTPSARQSSASSKPGHAGRDNAKTRNAFILMNNSG